MSFETLILEKKENIAKITLSRPERLNAINNALLTDLYNALEGCRRDENVRVVVITGAPRIIEREGVKELKYAFSAGWDMTTFGAPRQAEPPVDVYWYLYEYEKPTIAMVNGYAFGAGYELALRCDFIFASENSEIGLPEVERGFMPGCGGTQFLPRRVGAVLAKRVCLLGERISAREAERLGLVDVVVPMEKLQEVTMECAKKLASKAPLAVKTIKSVINRGIELPLEEALKLEREGLVALMQTEDFKEGVRAFFERRQPQWKGR